MAAPGQAWAISPMGAPATDLRRVKMHLERGGAALLPDAMNYVRVLQNGPTQPATTSPGLLPEVTMKPEMNHADGMGTQASSLAYLPRKLNASGDAQYACMPMYLLIGPQRHRLSTIPPKHVEGKRAAIVEPTACFPPFPVASGNLNVANPTVTVQTRNSLMVMGSSFVTASYYLARGNVGLESLLFSTGDGMLSATECSETLIFSQRSDWIDNVTGEARLEIQERIATTWQWAEVILRLVAGSAWLFILNAVWSYRKHPAQIQAHVPSVEPNAASASTTIADSPQS